MYNTLSGSQKRDNRAESLEALHKGDFDIFHPTYYDPYFLEAIGTKPFVLTVHDLIHELYPELFGLDDPVRNWKRQLVERATAIIAVSESTKRDLLSFYEIDSERIRVIGHGSNLRRSASAVSSQRAPYILFTGSRWGYKNFHFAVEALAPLLRRQGELTLLCTGAPFSADELRFFAELGIEKKVSYQRAEDAELFGLYSGAAFFLFPSYYEGFGIPILEAFEAGCPVLLSRASSFPEVAQDACLYFEPKDAASLLSAASALLGDSELRSRLVTKGRERLRAFSWERCRELTLHCYREFA